MEQTDKIMAKPRGSAFRAIAYFDRVDVKRRDMVNQYINAVYTICEDVGVDAAIVIAQASHETDKFRSYWWEKRLNPAGIGITGDPAQNADSRTFISGIAAARAQIAHLALYATGNIPDYFETSDDPRYKAYIDAYGHVAKATTIAGLTNTWGIDDNYAIGVVRHGKAIFGDLPVSEEFEEVEDDNTVQPVPVKWQGKPWTGQFNIRVNGKLYHATQGREVTTLDEVNLRVYADTSEPIIRTVPRGTRLKTLGWVVSQKVNNENRWWILSDHSRLWVGGTSQKPL